MSQTLADLPTLAEPYSLTADQVAHYQQDGHILLPGVLSADEVAAYRPVIASAVDRFKTETRPVAERDTYGRAFLQVMNLWVQEEAVRRFTLARRFAQIAAELMGVEGVRLYHDQALFKEGGGGPTPWHQDQHYWPLDTDNTITLWLPLVDITPEVGTMTFASKSNALGYLGDLPISDESEAEFTRFVNDRGFPLVNYRQMRAGDATFHSGWTLHSAPGNPTAATREVMTVIYFADGVRVGAADNGNRQNDLQSWLPGLAPGDLAASKLNPLLYHR